MGKVLRVLVVDDDPQIISALNRALRYEGYTVDVAYDGPAALRRMAEQPADIVLLDVMLPGLDGIEVCRRLRETHQSVAIVMLTARDGVQDRVLGLDTGADDYLVKPFANEELFSRLRAVLRRRPPGGGDTLTFADVTLTVGTRAVLRDDSRIALTSREFDVLEMLLRHARQVITREQLIDHVWGTDRDVVSNIVDACIAGLRQKLEARGGSRLIHTVRGVGFTLREEPM